MTQFKRPKRNIDGVLLLDKPHGLSSNTALQRARWLFQAAKAGHTGTLDPMATGLLPLCLGEATKFSQYLLNADKTYVAEIKFGAATTTGDAEGEVISHCPVVFDQDRLQAVLQQFVGEIWQTPPMYSALKHEGKALYEYARAGEEIERKRRQIRIYALELLEWNQPDVALVQVRCSKGTYVRTLAEDIAQALGSCAHLIGLRRTAIGDFRVEDAVTLETLEQLDLAQRDALLAEADRLVYDRPAVQLDGDSAFYLQRGQAVWVPQLQAAGILRLYGPGHVFLGVGELDDQGRVQPRRLIVPPVGQPAGN